ncbi:facilitated trehalose transporter Tret1 isoform X1 [Lepeophtheirus salmonis]|nr:facilitated trehalose transporter Tret1-like [Lepeophtheirus salmonis]
MEREEAGTDLLNGQKKVEVSSEEPPRVSITGKSLLISFVSSLGFFSAGLVRGWSAPAIASIQGFNNYTDYTLPQGPLSREEISWICSVAPMGAAIGSVMSSFLLHNYGRKVALMVPSFIMILSFNILALAFYSGSVEQMIFARIFNGLAVGITVPSGQIYITECVEPSVRGLLGSLPAASMALGIMICFMIGTGIPWHYLSFLCGAVPVIEFTLLAFMPESPTYLLLKNREDVAYKSLLWLRGNRQRHIVSKEFQKLKDDVQGILQEGRSGPPKKLHFSELKKSQVYKPLFIVTMITVFQQWNGVFAILFNLTIIFEALTLPISERMATILIGVVQFVMTLGSVFIVDKAGRRVMLMTSGLTMALANAVLGATFYLQKNSETYNSTTSLEWMPLFSLMLFIIGYSVGYASIPYVILGELLPNRLRGALGGVVALVHMLSMFVCVKLFLNMEAVIGFEGAFWSYAVITLFGVIFVYVLLPETKGKSLADIEKIFKEE